MTPGSHVRLFGVPVLRSDTEEALSAVERVALQDAPALVAYVNAHTLNLAWQDRSYLDLLVNASLVLNDGVGVQLAARMRRTPFPANLNGSDFNPRILGLAARRRWKVFFLGAAPGVATDAAERLMKRIPGLDVVGTHHGYFDDDAEVVETIRTSQADVLMVAMGNPLQERWLASHLAATGARLGIGVGAFFDFTTGTRRRAPAWMNDLGLEWLFRLGLEPVRMWRRYVVGNPLFLWRAWRTRRTDRPTPG